MARESYSLLQAKIEKEISKLQKKKESLQAKRRKPVMDSIVRSMREYDISPEDVATAFGKTAARRGTASGAARKTGAAVAKKTVAPKYRHPDTGETWSGRGKPPRWLAAAEEQGAKRESFLIQQPAA
ncbi:DNA-binding protein H-NS [plant metagenome]|uniref:DNA-binding protein H-NS n=1 Tax=plant metagenome TaxID=1297885 RepID=A0A484QED0_9ZZZZ